MIQERLLTRAARLVFACCKPSRTRKQGFLRANPNSTSCQKHRATSGVRRLVSARFHAGFDRAFEAVRNGWLGDVYMVRGVMNTDLSDRDRLPLAQYKGGMMFELGCHMIDRMVALLGRPKEVRGWLRHDSSVNDTLADNTLAVFEYGHAHAVLSTAARMPFEITGTNGAIVIAPIEPGNKIRVSMREARGPYKAGWQEVGEI